MSVEETFAELRGCELPEGSMIVDVIMIARVVDIETGEEVLVTTKTNTTSAFMAIGMISEAGMDINALVQWREMDEDE